MTEDKLEELANLIRQDIIKIITKAGSGHPGGSLGVADILTVLYFQVLEHRPKKPDWSERDRFLLSNGHVCPALYATLARAGYFDPKELLSLRQLGSRLQGHPSHKDLPFIEASTGSLGHGLPVACGMSLAAKKDKQDYLIWCLISDAEQQEGSTWEAAMLAAKYKLGNLKVIVDYNNIQLSGDISGIMPIKPLKEKYQAFGWRVFEVDGHDIDDLIKVFKKAKDYEDGPCVVFAKTTPGKGVSFMESKWQWHGKAPNNQQAKQALQELVENIKDD